MATIGMLRRLARELRLRRTAHVGKRPVVLGSVRVRGTGRITIGDEVRLDASQAPIDLHAGPGAEIVVERGVVIEAGCSIEAMESVRIGEGARIGAFTKIMDNHFHPLEGDRTDRPASRAVTVEPGASVGPRAVILPGTHIGRGARVGAGSVVSRRIPDGADVHGFPLQSRRKAE
jgi:acetyltransferase-like isoleucine patch superfamily enzyme